MKTTVLMALGVVGLLAAVHAMPAQAGQSSAPTYVDENDKDPSPLKIGAVQGKIHGLGGEPMSGASISLFTEDGHKLVATVVSDKDGKYRFDKVEKGLYRVVARVPGLCPANIPVLVESGLLLHRKLDITMQPKDLDRCSARSPGRCRCANASVIT